MPPCHGGGRGFKSRQGRSKRRALSLREGLSSRSRQIPFERMLRGSVAQLVERTTENREVTGSTPVGATGPSLGFYWRKVFILPGQRRFFVRSWCGCGEARRVRLMSVPAVRGVPGPVWGRLLAQIGSYRGAGQSIGYTPTRKMSMFCSATNAE